ncbi:MAG: hypothetical protein ACI837_003187 [Crocinitomicaceae bacterium]|jgi:hypothetical protein
MKKTGLILTMMSLLTFSYAQDSDSTGLEGDNLDLNGVLELFEESEDIEDFERKLNTESNGVNNLDLDGDGEVDYIRVVDHADSSSHSFALQVPLSEDESQDVAVIEMDAVDDETVNLQVIGDAELYGEDYMLEPMDEKNPSVVVNVNAWRPVRHIYGPRYVVYASPYRYRHHPRWFKPWKRVAWRVYHPRVMRYHRPYYRRTTVRRCHRAHGYYHVRRAHSKTFHAHHHHKHAAHKNNGGHKAAGHKPAGHNKPGGKQHAGGKKQGQKGGASKKQGARSKRGNKSVTPTKRPGAVKKKGAKKGSSRGGARKGKR